MKPFRLLFILVLTAFLFMTGCASEEESPQADQNGETSQNTAEPEPSASSPDQETIKLSMATFWPSTAFQVAEMHNQWIEEVQKRTNQRVEITLHPGEVLLGAKEIYNGVLNGVADIGTTCPSYTPGMFPLVEAFELPGYLNANAQAASMTINEGYKKIKQELDIDEFKDVKVLFLWATGPGNIMSTKPVRNLEDMSGMEIRAVGGTVPSIESLGGVPHSMPMSEAYLALDQGLVNGILAPNETLKAFRLAEVTDYITNTPFLYNIVFMKIMNKDTWNSLPPDVQEVFQEMNQEFAATYGQMMDEFSSGILEESVQEHHLEIINLADEQREKWLKRLQPVVDNWIKEHHKQGLPAEQTVEIVRELDQKYSKTN